MRNKKILLFSLFFVVFGFCLLVNSENKVYAADVEQFNSWVAENSLALNQLFEGYDYVVLNNTNWGGNAVTIYYSNGQNNVFSFDWRSDWQGVPRATLNCTSSLGNGYYGVYTFNPSDDNNFILPTSLNVEQITDDRRIINNTSSENWESAVLFCSGTFHKSSGDVEIKKSFPLWSILTRAVQGVEMKGILAEIIAILPLILVAVASFLGFRKALSMLLTLLRAS